MQLKRIITQHQTDIAFIVGNGINRYPDNPKAISWDDLLMKLWNRFSPDTYNQVPKGITITEFYDLLDIATSSSSSTNVQIQQEACNLLEDWTFHDHHVAFVQRAHDIGAPILTTNFDLLLPTSIHLQQYYTDTKTFTDYYPWTTYYGDEQLEYPTDGFGVWFVNGFVKYHRSIRLGLSHYMGSVEKARRFLHKGDDRRLFGGKNQNNWEGVNTWLHIIFNKPLCIFGLGLEENEVFIRWLLIERAKYFKKFPDRKKQGWYVTLKNGMPDGRTIGKKQFLEGTGFEIVETENYDDIYLTPWT